MRDRRTGRGQPLEFGIGRLNAMGHDGSLTAQFVSLVHGQVVARPRENSGDLGYFPRVLVDVGLKSQTLVFGHQRLTDLEHGFRG